MHLHDGRELEIHGPDADLHPPEPLEFGGGRGIEVEDGQEPEILEVLLEPTVGLDLLGDILGAGPVFEPAAGRFLIRNDRGGEVVWARAGEAIGSFSRNGESSRSIKVSVSVSRTIIR